MEKIDLKTKRILDACCGGKMFWFNKNHPDVLFVDNRVMEKQVIWRGKDGEQRQFEVKPDAVMDFRALDLPDGHFSLVVFDPPHLMTRNGKMGWMGKKYGSLDRVTWRDDLTLGFRECFRVLKPGGVMVFKWSEAEIPLSEVLKLTPERPLFGHPSGKAQGTHWVTFMKS
ncbi:MAG: class I SAM-dependent methyltransferase [Sphaerochaeta sp.]|jgi:SAM-dependent methyltransferase|nr:class I SAM-dependent methyltransferase [Sphaerochaeta sp.]